MNSANSKDSHVRSSISEPDLATADGFPPGTTVDELRLYRRKRPAIHVYPQDNLIPLGGSFKHLKSEYRRSFQNFFDLASSCDELHVDKLSLVPPKKPGDNLKVEGSIQFESEYNQSYVEKPVERVSRRRRCDSLRTINMDDTDEEQKARTEEAAISEVHSSFVEHPEAERQPLYRRPTTLNIEGEFDPTTETAEKFIEFSLEKRPELVKKKTTLKLEGEMNTTSEMHEKFSPYDYQPRPRLCKKLTNLHLEGDLNIITEKQEKYVAHNMPRRHHLTKSDTNLHLEGDLYFMPEYRDEFVEHKNMERAKLSIPMDNLKTDGFRDVPARPNENHPLIPFLRDSGTPSRRQSFSEAEKRPHERRIDADPEFRNVYADRQRMMERGSPQRVRAEPEYRRSYEDFPRERPTVRRPECNLTVTGEIDHRTENSEKFVEYHNVVRSEPLKRQPELKLEGRFECQPEYRKAYIDYLIREKAERRQRPLDNLGNVQSRAFEVVSDKETTAKSPVKTSSPKPPPARKRSSSISSSTRSSTSSRQRTQPSAAPKQLSRIERSAFGPRLTVPKMPTGRLSPSSNRSTSDSETSSRRRNQRRFAETVRVENLAVPQTARFSPPISSVRSRWMKDSSVESASSFTLLDRELNNNQEGKRVDSGAVYYREQKWVPSWCNAPSLP